MLLSKRSVFVCLLLLLLFLTACAAPLQNASADTSAASSSASSITSKAPIPPSAADSDPITLSEAENGLLYDPALYPSLPDERTPPVTDLPEVGVKYPRFCVDELPVLYSITDIEQTLFALRHLCVFDPSFSSLEQADPAQLLQCAVQNTPFEMPDNQTKVGKMLWQNYNAGVTTDMVRYGADVETVWRLLYGDAMACPHGDTVYQLYFEPLDAYFSTFWENIALQFPQILSVDEIDDGVLSVEAFYADVYMKTGQVVLQKDDTGLASAFVESADDLRALAAQNKVYVFTLRLADHGFTVEGIVPCEDQ